MATKKEILTNLERAFNIEHNAFDLRKMTVEDRLVIIVEKQAAAFNAMIAKQNRLADVVLGPQKPQMNKDGIQIAQTIPPTPVSRR